MAHLLDVITTVYIHCIGETFLDKVSNTWQVAHDIEWAQLRDSGEQRSGNSGHQGNNYSLFVPNPFISYSHPIIKTHIQCDEGWMFLVLIRLIRYRKDFEDDCTDSYRILMACCQLVDSLFVIIL
jgi:hypothetical protein